MSSIRGWFSWITTETFVRVVYSLYPHIAIFNVTHAKNIHDIYIYISCFHIAPLPTYTFDYVTMSHVFCCHGCEVHIFLDFVLYVIFVMSLHFRICFCDQSLEINSAWTMPPCLSPREKVLTAGNQRGFSCDEWSGGDDAFPLFGGVLHWAEMMLQKSLI